jgi:two-component system, NarL family, nitrate/nitrite response regulator NarL
MVANVKVVLVGRNTLVREGLSRILAEDSFHVIQSVEDVSGLGPIDLAGRGEDLLAVVDCGGGPFSIDTVQQLQGPWPDCRIVILADAFDFDGMISAFQAGVHGYIVKQIACEPLLGSLKLVAMGEKVLPSELVSLLPTAMTINRPPQAKEALTESLSEREFETLQCLISGYPNKIIARQLGISEATVKVHVKAILRKLKLHNRTQAAMWAVSNGIDLQHGEDLHAVPRSGAALIRAA